MSYDSPAPSAEEPEQPITETTESGSSTQSESSPESTSSADSDPSTEKEA